MNLLEVWASATFDFTNGQVRDWAISSDRERRKSLIWLRPSSSATALAACSAAPLRPTGERQFAALEAAGAEITRL